MICVGGWMRRGGLRLCRGRGGMRGTDLDYLRELCRYWRQDYDWRAVEAQLNRFPQYTTTIDNQPIPLHPRPQPQPRRVAAGDPPRVAGVDHRVCQGDRAAAGALPRRVPLAARLRLLRPDHRIGLDSPAHGGGIAGADEPPGLRGASAPRAGTGERWSPLRWPSKPPSGWWAST